MFTYYLWKDEKVLTVRCSQNVCYPAESFRDGGFTGCYCYDMTPPRGEASYGQIASLDSGKVFSCVSKEEFPPEFLLALLLLD